MGTVGYMSPEQACGKPLDRRTDIWAFGCVLYEALTGKRAFRGNTTTEVLAAILEREPDWTALPPTLPSNVASLVRRCLRKDPHARVHDAGDARLEIEEALAGVGTGVIPVIRPRTVRPKIIAAALAGLLVGGAVAGWFAYQSGRGSVAPPRVTRFMIDVPEGRSIIPSFNPQVIFSRDAKTLLFSAVSNVPRTPSVTFQHRLEDLETKELAKGLGTAVFSPDDRWLMLLDTPNMRVVKYPLGGGAPVPLITQAKFYSRGDWGSDGPYSGGGRRKRAGSKPERGAERTRAQECTTAAGRQGTHLHGRIRRNRLVRRRANRSV